MNKINRISENKNQKIDVLVVSEHCETIWIEKWKRLIIKGGGGEESANPQLGQGHKLKCIED